MTKKVKPYLFITILATALAVVTALVGPPGHPGVGWIVSILVLVVCWICDYHRRELRRIADETSLRTIEALALAVKARDYSSQTHFRRVEVYAVEIGRELGLNASELRALGAAALLHDIGTLAVPEHILSKPGSLTAMEFEKIKIHPLVGAEILEQVEFPYPAAPIVRSHHEKWDGTGYPEGLSGEDIPIGARILAVVDCFDALSSDRPYRKALPVAEAVERVISEAGRSFDPRVVKALARSNVALEQMVEAQPAARVQPAAAAIAAAGLEAQTLFELMRELGASLSLDETLSALSQSLKRICPYDCIAIYVCQGDKLIPEYVNGDDFHLFSSLEIPMGEGLSGRVARSKEPIVNGDPSVEAGYLHDADKFSTLRSALVAPLEGSDGVVGVLALYHAGKSAFTRDHLRILLALTQKVALSIVNALRYREAETCAMTDGLTGLPNARSIFLHLDAEIARCKRENNSLTILVCDLDGFKRVNDSFGHLEGDRVLRRVAQRIRESCREYDYVARMGGDEFVVVLPGHPSEASPGKARILSGIAAQAAACLPYSAEPLSMSVGEATFPADGLDAEQLLAKADRRMYQVKRQNKRRSQASEVGNPMPCGSAFQ